MFLIQPTTTAQWQALVKEISERRGICIDIAVENYLVITLDAFTKNVLLLETPIAIEFLTAVQTHSGLTNHKLRNVGDRCLIIAGFFNQQSEKHNVNPEYFAEIGQQSYLTLGERDEKGYNPALFLELGHRFTDLTTILYHMHQGIKP